MNAQLVIELVNKQGLTLAARDGKLIIYGKGDKQTQLTPELKDLLVAWKSKIITILKLKMTVLGLIIDGKKLTCLGPVSKTTNEAIHAQQIR